MSNMTMAIEDKMHKKMKVHSEVKWTEVARKAFLKKLKEIEQKEEDDKAWRNYALKHALEDWDDADELIRY